MSDTLKPCPFCGGEAELDRTMERFEYCTGGPNSVMDYGYWVYCTKCDASLGAINVPPSSPEEATRDWNRRADLPVPPEVAATLFKGLEWYSETAPTAETQARIDAALAWLEQQTGQ